MCLLPMLHTPLSWIWFLSFGSSILLVNMSVTLVQFSHSVMSDSLQHHARQASLSSTNTQSLLKLMSIKLVMPSNQLILCRPFCLQSFLASGSFPVSQFFASGGQSGASVSVIPVNIQGWCPCSPRDSPRVFSNNTVQKHQLFSDPKQHLMLQFVFNITLFSMSAF